jgi:hypothetical protein
MYGKIRAKVEQKYDDETNKFQVKTKSAVAGVRGTDFFTSYTPSNNQTKVVTFEGSVRFGVPGANGSIANSVMVGVGQSSNLDGGSRPTAPMQIPREELSKMNDVSSADRGPASSGDFSMMKDGDLPMDNGGKNIATGTDVPPPPPILPDPKTISNNFDICKKNPALCGGGRKLILNVNHGP